MKLPKQIEPYQLSFSQEIFVDLFAGGGGASWGIEEATGIPVYAAVNHDPDAIAMHMTNHPYTKHHQTSVWDVEPDYICEGRPVGLLWASPDCKHFSKARGGKPVDKNIRSLSWVVLKWALEVRPRVLMMENVEEIQTWGPLKRKKGRGGLVWIPDPEHTGETFKAFIGMLTDGVPHDHPALKEACQYLRIGKNNPKRYELIKGLGYKVEYRKLVAAAHVAEFKGQDIGQSMERPLRTITAGAGEFAVIRTQIVRYAEGQDMRHWPKIRELLNTHCGYDLKDDEVILLFIGGIAHFIGDITLRMLTPRELYNAMGFAPDYIIDVDYLGRPYAKNKQVARCGNAVCPPMAKAMVQANLPEYCVMVNIRTLAQFHNRVCV